MDEDTDHMQSPEQAARKYVELYQRAEHHAKFWDFNRADQAVKAADAILASSRATFGVVETDHAFNDNNLPPPYMCMDGWLETREYHLKESRRPRDVRNVIGSVGGEPLYWSPNQLPEPERKKYWREKLNG